MHTYKNYEVSFNYNGDFSGEVEIVRDNYDGTCTKMKVRADAILRFVADAFVVPERIAAMEKASYLDLLLK